MDVSVTIRQDDASAALKAIGVSGHLRHVAEAAAEAVASAARVAAMAKGGRSFWREIAQSVNSQPDGDGFVVGATHFAAGFKQTGGTISAPGRGAGSMHRRALTVPLGIARRNRWDTDEARRQGYRLFRQGDTLFGEQPLRGRRRGGDSGAVPLFALRRSVSQRPDPWFPEGQALADAVSDGISLFASQQGGFPL